MQQRSSYWFLASRAELRTLARLRAFARGGRWGLAGSILKRIARIYAYYFLTTLVVVSIAFLAMKYLNVELEFYDFEVEDTVGTYLRALAMIQPTPYAGILVLYIILTVMVVPAFVRAQGSLRFVLLAVSAVIWGASQIVDTTHLAPNLFFNPFAWQFLFSIGVMFGVDRELGSPILGYLRGLRWVLPLA